MKTKEFQKKSLKHLKEIFGENEVDTEWSIAKDSQDDCTREMYCPRLDLAVKPYNVEVGSEKRDAIIGAYENKKIFMNRIIEKSRSDYGLKLNKNPRCLLAIELVYSGSRKHMMGDITNASIIGYLGIVVALTEKKYEELSKIRKYIEFARRAGKIDNSGSLFNNVVIVKGEDFLEIIKSCSN